MFVQYVYKFINDKLQISSKLILKLLIEYNNIIVWNVLFNISILNFISKLIFD